MSKIEKSIVAYNDESSLYASSNKALREHRKLERLRMRNERIAALGEIIVRNRASRKAYKRDKKQEWKKTKKELWDKAHSKSYFDEAKCHFDNTRDSYSDRDVAKYNEKAQKKHYRKLVRQHRKWR